MATPVRSAAGPAAGYHFQIQQALLTLVDGRPGCEVSIESLDDLVVEDPDGTTHFQQLKHSLSPVALTDRSRSLWRALDAWMDLLDDANLYAVDELVLVSTDDAPDGSSAALLREDDQSRDARRATRNLLAVAQDASGSRDTSAARTRFAALDERDRGRLIAKVVVRDARSGVADFREELRNALEVGLPRNGADGFLDSVVGWWERRAVDMLVGRRATVGRDEVLNTIARLRDSYGPETLPALEGERSDLSKALEAAYAGAPFVRQLELILVREERLQAAIRDYHRAYTRRSRWLQQDLVLLDELQEWEDRLVDEWARAWQRMLDDFDEASIDDDARARTGRTLLGSLEVSTLSPLRDGRDRVVHIGTLHGLADVRRIGWHPDFEARLLALLGPPTPGLTTSGAFTARPGETSS